MTKNLDIEVSTLYFILQRVPNTFRGAMMKLLFLTALHLPTLTNFCFVFSYLLLKISVSYFELVVLKKKKKKKKKKIVFF